MGIFPKALVGSKTFSLGILVDMFWKQDANSSYNFDLRLDRTIWFQILISSEILT